MKKILVFAGTTEGRLIAKRAGELCLDCYVSTATEYGKEILGHIEHVNRMSGRMEVSQMCAFIWDKKIELVIDATHPFAREVTENIQKACRKADCEYVRCLREKEEEDSGGGMKVFASVREAAAFLKDTKGNILLTTGTKELKEYRRIPGFEKRCYARVLSTVSSVKQAAELGFEGKHLIAMQGPLSKEMNIALLRQVKAAYFVTKESGQAGGFQEKRQAAEETGTELVVIRRPREEGKNLAEVLEYLAYLAKVPD